MGRLLLPLLILVVPSFSYSQINSFNKPTNQDTSTFSEMKFQQKLKLRSAIIPAALISYGFIALESDGLKALDNNIMEEIWTEHPHHTTNVDNYLQYAPMELAYTLNAVGIHGQNNLRDRTMIYLMANAMMGITVNSLKMITKIKRPDGYGANAFPSGHTATAFVAAEFLRTEYKDISPVIGITGYAMAISTAYFRLYNNRHWFRDLLPGAGIGILSTKVAYWMYPKVKKLLFGNRPANTVLIPYYQNKVLGLSFVHEFAK